MIKASRWTGKAAPALVKFAILLALSTFGLATPSQASALNRGVAPEKALPELIRQKSIAEGWMTYAKLAYTDKSIDAAKYSAIVTTYATLTGETNKFITDLELALQDKNFFLEYLKIETVNGVDTAKFNQDSEAVAFAFAAFEQSYRNGVGITTSGGAGFSFNPLSFLAEIAKGLLKQYSENAANRKTEALKQLEAARFKAWYELPGASPKPAS